MSNTLLYRVSQSEKKYDELDKKVELILTNHLPHLREQMIELSGKMDSLRTRIGVLSMVNVVAIILGLLVGKIL